MLTHSHRLRTIHLHELWAVRRSLLPDVPSPVRGHLRRRPPLAHVCGVGGVSLATSTYGRPPWFGPGLFERTFLHYDSKCTAASIFFPPPPHRYNDTHGHLLPQPYIIIKTCIHNLYLPLPQLCFLLHKTVHGIHCKDDNDTGYTSKLLTVFNGEVN